MEKQLSKNEEEFMLKALSKGWRVDGRGLKDVRSVLFEFGLTPGQVEVQLGITRVLCGVTHELATPYAHLGNQGMIDFGCTFPAHMDKSKADIDRIVHIVERGIRESSAIDLESLCVLHGDKVWKLFVHLAVIQDTGMRVCVCLFFFVRANVHTHTQCEYE